MLLVLELDEELLELDSVLLEELIEDAELGVELDEELL